jgi:pre-mRNA-splicing factor CWC26
MPPSLDSYIAARYLVADPKPSKKRKRKGASEEAGLVVTEEDESGWGHFEAKPLADSEDDGPVLVTGTTSEFRKTKNSNWKSIGGGVRPSPLQEDATVADAIIASAAAEQLAACEAADDAPVVSGDSDVVKMKDGTHAGLQSTAAITAQLEKRRREEREEFKHIQAGGEEETAYRDAAGNRIDISIRRAQARKAAMEAEQKERLAKEALKGDIQKMEARKRRERVEDAKFMPLARTIDDEELNRELKEQGRWNDPMMRFLGDTRRRMHQAPGKKSSHPVYPGPAPPNRYGIRPGYRWDGVDRGNGFEAERFKAFNRREMNKELDYSWQIDV